MTDALHAPCAPSSMARTMQCPGSVTLQRQFPDQGDDTASREGTAAHEVLANMLVGEIVSVGAPTQNGVLVDRKMIDGAEMMMDDIEAALGSAWPHLIVVEQQLPAGSFGPHVYGTPDVRTIDDPEVPRITWDFKYGHGPVEVYKNPQLLVYEELRPLKFTDNIDVRIVQPRAFHADGHVRRWTTNVTMWARTYAEIREAVTEAMGQMPRLRVGSECDYCSARHACPELARVGGRQIDYAKMSQPFDLAPAALGDELAYVDLAMTLLKARLSGLDAQATRMISQGQHVPGWELGRGRGSTDWNVPAEHVINMGMLHGLNLAKPAEAVTPRQAKELGFDPDLVRDFSKHNPGAAKLTKASSKAEQVFGK